MDALSQLLPELPISLQQQLGDEMPLDLLVLALTHPSAVGEGAERTLLSNQRLEFLGDAVVGLAAAEHFYRSEAMMREGDLTQRKAGAVQRRSLARAARRLELGRYLRLSPGEEAAGGRNRDTILSDAFEAVVGALFVARGFEAARDFVLRSLAEELDVMVESVANIKNRLQEHTQAIGLGTPVYRTVETQSAGHERRFAAEVLLQGEVRGQGKGRTKKEAECQAAAVAFVEVGGSASDAASSAV